MNRNDINIHTMAVISQLAVATTSDHGTVATLTATNAKLNKQLEEAKAIHYSHQYQYQAHMEITMTDQGEKQ
jgi:hypothetical protein